MWWERVRAPQIVPENKNDLRVAILEEWKQILQEMIQSLLECMLRRMAVVTHARGGK